jgi:dTDP-4-dehydrorhamnose reductase
MKVLVIGATGQLGSELVREGTRRGHDVVGGRFLLEWNEETMDEVMKVVKPDIVFCAGAMTNVDACEEDPEKAMRINVDGVARASRLAFLRTTRMFVAYSTDYVFDGAHGPNQEMDMCRPLNRYGESKMRMEEALEVVGRSLVIRTSGLYGFDPNQKNFLYQVLRAGLSAREGGRPPLPVPFDQFLSPTFVDDLATASFDFEEAGLGGVRHFAGPCWVSKYQWACEILERWGLPENAIRRVATAELNQKARRPVFAGLVTCRHRVGLARPIREALLELKKIITL